MTPKQERFVAEYLVDLNATQAAIRAGYSEANADVTGPRMLGNVGIQEAIAKGQAKASAKVELTQEWVIDSLVTNVKDAKDAGQLAVVKGTLELLGKHLGLFMDIDAKALAKMTDSELDSVRRKLKLVA